MTSVIKVSTDEGISGFGEVCPLGAGYMEAYRGGVPEAFGGSRPPRPGSTRLRGINRTMDATLDGHHYVKSPIDIACWDILGQATGLPVATCSAAATATTSAFIARSRRNRPRRWPRSVAGYRAEGYRRFQLKVGGDPDDDIARIRAVAAAAPARRPAHRRRQHRLAACTRRCASCARVRDVDVYIEQPCLTYEECLSVRRHTDHPFVLDEIIDGLDMLLRAGADLAMDVVNLKISKLGGLTKARQARDLCVALGIAMTLEDSWGGDIVTAAIAHLAHSTPPEFLSRPPTSTAT